VQLVNKKILLVSPQPWNNILISKHHYAKCLVKKGNVVYFVNPPIYRFNKPLFSIEKSEIENLYVIQINLKFPEFVKFKIKTLYNLVSNYIFSKLQKQLEPDILWNFDNNNFFQSEAIFKNCFRIFHPVDAFVAKSKNFENIYNIVFSVSDIILDSINHSKKYFINHGVSNEFLIPSKYIPINSKIKVGYVGNLNIPNIDYKILESLIKNRKDVDFIFIGPYDESLEFYNNTKSLVNITFTGKKFGKEYFEIMSKCDMFLLLYISSDLYKLDNSHKILEYMSFGKVILSTKISAYNNSDLIEMVEDNQEYENIFNSIVNNIKNFNCQKLKSKRIDFANDNSYDNQIIRIEKLINETN
jgi:hypothetical protein